MQIDMILCRDQDNVIGEKDGSMLWYIKEDMDFFKERHRSYDIFLSGNKTFQTLPKYILNKMNYVLSRNKTTSQSVNVIYFTMAKLKQLLLAWKKVNKKMLVIGGASVYKQMNELFDIDNIYLTTVHHDIDFGNKELVTVDLDLSKYERKHLRQFFTNDKRSDSELECNIYKYTKIRH